MKMPYAVLVLFAGAACAPSIPFVSANAPENRQSADSTSAADNLIPWPRSVERRDGCLILGETTRIVVENEALLPLARVLSEELHAVSGLRVETATGAAGSGDILLKLTRAANDEAYALRIDGHVTIEGGNYQAVALGTATLLQLLHIEPARVTLPRVRIEDSPHSAYRGLLIDVARNYHSIDTLRQCVRLCRHYKIRYLQLHLTDDQAFTFPSQAYPRLTSQNWHGGPAYTLEELRELEVLRRRAGRDDRARIRSARTRRRDEPDDARIVQDPRDQAV